MSTQWTAPGATGGDDASATPEGDPASTGTGPVEPSGPAPRGGPRRELVQSMPLFPLRPLGLGEILGAAVRIYRLRARSVLGVAAAVYGVAFVITTFATGASMVPIIGDMQAVMEDPQAEVAGLDSLADAAVLISSTALTLVVTLVAAALVTVALTRVALGEAVGRPVPTEEMWATMRRRGLPAVVVSLLIGLLGTVLFAVPFVLGMLPLVLLQEASVLTIVLLVLGLVVGVLAAIWLWARTVLAVPALVIEDTTVLGALRRSFGMTRGRRFWRVLGIALLVYVLYSVAMQVIAGVFGTLATILYLAILLASSFEAIVLGMAVLTILSMLGSYAASFLLAPFLSAGIVAVYADNRMRHEAWDVELTRRAREAWDEGVAR
ncbi:glycerophosphoryl diester phosphodiesterase membrane domain-containing protein [Brachybacterium sp. AOP43-C2-M15]|uniref:glycerophosphoryl diester phosphodiesterase membrane domain-containing protein n=1 Tax=Brachybacterium sp. AOP43-C2-M15 TaxID=3457661 RepID=UPI0040338E04